jgi:hypothetical protein
MQLGVREELARLKEKGLSGLTFNKLLDLQASRGELAFIEQLL